MVSATANFQSEPALPFRPSAVRRGFGERASVLLLDNIFKRRIQCTTSSRYLFKLVEEMDLIDQPIMVAGNWDIIDNILGTSRKIFEQPDLSNRFLQPI